MANPQNPPVEISNYSETAAIASAAKGDDNRILSKNVIPALETRLSRFVLAGERQATIAERARSPLVRFSVEEMIGFLEDAAVQVTARVDSQYLQSLKNIRQPDILKDIDFSLDMRILGGGLSIDGTAKAQRLSGDDYNDIISRGEQADQTMPVYVLEGGDVHIYGGFLDNPTTAEIDVITVPQPTSFTATGTYNTSTSVFTITTGGPLDEDLHTLVNAVIVDSNGGPVIRGVMTDIVGQVVRLDIDNAGFLNSGTITMSWKTPGYSSLNNYLEKAVVALASADMFAALGEVTAATSAIEEFEAEMTQYGLRFFKI